LDIQLTFDAGGCAAAPFIESQILLSVHGDFWPHKQGHLKRLGVWYEVERRNSFNRFCLWHCTFSWR
jgi:hypothetical protein